MDEQPPVPVLGDLGDRLERAFRDRERAPARRPRRVRWRVAFAVAALGLLTVPAAIGTKTIWAPGVPFSDPTGPVTLSTPVRVAHGERNGERWWLVAYESTRGLCLQLAHDGGNGGNCEDLEKAGRDVNVISMATGRELWFFGWTTARVARVRITTIDGTVAATTHAPDPVAYRRGGFTTRFRVFFAPMPGVREMTSAPVTEALGRDGKLISHFP